MCKGCDGWEDNVVRPRDFRQSKDGPEEIKGHPKRRSKKWCKNKEGREHVWEQVVWYSYKYIDSYGKERIRNSYRWRCKGCGKIEWSEPKPDVGKHEHCYCITKIAERRWRNFEMIYEECCVCGGQGRSYKFYN